MNIIKKDRDNKELKSITLDGQEFLLLPMKYYKLLEEQIIDLVADDFPEQEDDDDYTPFILEDYVRNPVALARIKAGITQKELADALATSQSWISQLEKSTTITADSMHKVTVAIEKIISGRKGDGGSKSGKIKRAL